MVHKMPEDVKQEATIYLFEVRAAMLQDPLYQQKRVLDAIGAMP